MKSNINDLVELQSAVQTKMNGCAFDVLAISLNYDIGLLTKNEFIHQIHACTSSYFKSIDAIKLECSPVLLNSELVDGMIRLSQTLNK